MINPNKFIGLKQQESMGPLTDPQSFQQQFNVNRFTQPLAVPGDQNQTMSPMMQQEKSKVQTVQNDPKLQEGSDASYGISGYVNTEKEYKQALQEKNHPNVYGSPAKQTNYPNAGVKRRATQPLPKPDMPDNRLKRTTEKIEQVTQQNAPLKQTDYPHADPNKGRPYVVNKEKTGTSKDTLYLPKDTYVSKSGLAEDSDIDNAARKAAADNIYNYTKGNKNYNFEYLEDRGKVKYKN